MTPPRSTAGVPGSTTTTTAPFSNLIPKNLHLAHTAMTVGAYLVIVLLLVGTLVTTIFWVRRLYHALRTRKFLEDTVSYYELVPRGDRPADAATLVMNVGKAISDLAGDRRARLSVIYWRDGRLVRSGLAIAGLKDAKRAAGAVAAQIGRAVGADAKALPVCPVPDTPCMSYASRTAFSSPSTLASAFSGNQGDISAFSNFVVHTLSLADGPAWLMIGAKVMSVRERNAARDFANRSTARMNALTGGSQSPWNEAKLLMRAMVAAGSTDQATADGLCNIGAFLPHYESTLKAQPVHDAFPGAASIGAFALGFGVLGVLGHFLGSSRLELDGAVGFALLGAATVVGVLDLASVAKRTMRRWLRAGMLPVPPRPWGSYPHGIHGGAQRSGVEDHDDGSRNKDSHPYRFVRRALVFTPEQIAYSVALASASVTSTGTTSSRSVNAPAEVREAVGARLGYDPSMVGVQVPDRNRTGGVMVIGDPGQGKSSLLLSVWASDLMARSDEYARTKECKRAMIWLETKGEGAQRTLRVAAAMGYDEQTLCFVDVTSTTGWQLDLVDWNNTAASAEALAEAMRYAFPDRSIMDDSEETLKLVLALALAITKTRGILEAAGCTPNQGYMRTAHQLLGGDPVQDYRQRLCAVIERTLGMAAEPKGANKGGKGRFSEVRAGAAPTEIVFPGLNTDLGIAYRGYASKLRSRTADTEGVFSAPRNKISKLLDAKSLWHMDAGRPRVSLAQMLTARMAAVVNLGGEHGFPDELRERLGAMLTYLLWQAIKANCDNWDRSGRSVAIYADELADIAGTGNAGSQDVVRSMFDGGRSRGVWCNFATQRLEQLPPGTAGAALSANSKVYLRQENPHAAEAAAHDLVGTEEGSFTATDIRRLPPMVGVARLHVDDALPPAFSICVVHDDQLTARNLRSSVLSPTAPLVSADLVDAVGPPAA